MSPFLLTYVSASLFVLGINAQDVLVNIDQGTLRGKEMSNRNGETIYAFQDIPYGKAPINELRFKAPQPADGWEGIRDATRDDTRCVQHGETLLGVEDCLHLNVYTPELPNGSTNLRPVMVWIHGGSFTIGSGNTLVYGPEFIMTQDVILVTINYRLGILGAFSVDDSTLGVTGNLYLKDQSLALKWVKENIIRFLGDPDNITIFGESAGGASVHLQMLSPMSAGYFHRVISQSGVGNADWINGQRNSGILLAEELGVQTENLQNMLTTLQEIPIADVIPAAVTLDNRHRYFLNPIVEIESSEPVFLHRSVNYLLESGEYNHVPLLIGVNDAEGLLFQVFSLMASGQNVTVDNFLEFIPLDLDLDHNSDAAIGLTDRIKQFYFGDEEPSRANITPTVNLHSDFSFIFPAYTAALKHLKNLEHPIFFYLFTADTALNFLSQLDETMRNFPGAAHADELTYLFYNQFVPANIQENSVEDLGIKRMVQLWTNFAKYNNPTPEGTTAFTWEALADNQFKYLNIGTSASILINGPPLPERMQFWSEVYAEYYPGSK